MTDIIIYTTPEKLLHKQDKYIVNLIGLFTTIILKNLKC